MRTHIFWHCWLFILATALSAQERPVIWAHIIIISETDALAHAKEMGFVPYSDVSPLPTSYYFIDEQTCIDSMKDRLIWETGRKETTLLYNGIEERRQFITSWRQGELYTHHSCLKLFPKQPSHKPEGRWPSPSGLTQSLKVPYEVWHMIRMCYQCDATLPWFTQHIPLLMLQHTLLGLTGFTLCCTARKKTAKMLL